jgi:hypothetical protein
MLQLPFWLAFDVRLVIELIFTPILFHQDSHPCIQEGELIDLF